MSDETTGLEPLDGRLFGPEQACFGCAPHHPHGFRLAFRREGEAVVTEFVPGDHHQGPPGIMHGGLVATLADELAVWTILGLLGKFGFTASFEGRIQKPVRVGVAVRGEGRLEKAGPRLVDVRVSLTQEEASCFAGSFRFVLVDRHSAERILGGPIPPAWERFCK